MNDKVTIPEAERVYQRTSTLLLDAVRGAFSKITEQLKRDRDYADSWYQQTWNDQAIKKWGATSFLATEKGEKELLQKWDGKNFGDWDGILPEDLNAAHGFKSAKSQFNIDVAGRGITTLEKLKADKEYAGVGTSIERYRHEIFYGEKGLLARAEERLETYKSAGRRDLATVLETGLIPLLQDAETRKNPYRFALEIRTYLDQEQEVLGKAMAADKRSEKLLDRAFDQPFYLYAQDALELGADITSWNQIRAFTLLGAVKTVALEAGAAILGSFNEEKTLGETWARAGRRAIANILPINPFKGVAAFSFDFAYDWGIPYDVKQKFVDWRWYGGSSLEKHEDYRQWIDNARKTGKADFGEWLALVDKHMDAAYQDETQTGQAKMVVEMMRRLEQPPKDIDALPLAFTYRGEKVTYHDIMRQNGIGRLDRFYTDLEEEMGKTPGLASKMLGMEIDYSALDEGGKRRVMAHAVNAYYAYTEKNGGDYQVIGTDDKAWTAQDVIVKSQNPAFTAGKDYMTRQQLEDYLISEAKKAHVDENNAEWRKQKIEALLNNGKGLERMMLFNSDGSIINSAGEVEALVVSSQASINEAGKKVFLNQETPVYSANTAVNRNLPIVPGNGAEAGINV